jgi:hypothetical protein
MVPRDYDEQPPSATDPGLIDSAALHEILLITGFEYGLRADARGKFVRDFFVSAIAHPFISLANLMDLSASY